MTHFRRHSALAVAFLIVAIGAIPIASATGSWLAHVDAPAAVGVALATVGFGIVMAVPLLLAAWAWRAGTDADPDAIRVRTLTGTRSIPWSSVSTLHVDQRGAVLATLLDGTEVRLTAVPADRVDALVAASGQTVQHDGGGGRAQ